MFALDSNTLIAPVTADSDRWLLQQRLKSLETEQLRCLKALSSASQNEIERDGLLEDLETLQEEQLDLQRRLQPSQAIDSQQLNWLRDGLIASHRDPKARGRILTMHHPPYVTERTKWSQADTLAVRHRLQAVLDDVQTQLEGETTRVVDLVLSGHAHCLEVLRTHGTGHGDAHTNWVVCGGSGYSLRNQRKEGPEIRESEPQGEQKLMASSELYIGRGWPQAEAGGGAYSALRVDISSGRPLRIRLTPLVSSRQDQEWIQHALDPIDLPL